MTGKRDKGIFWGGGVKTAHPQTREEELSNIPKWPWVGFSLKDWRPRLKERLSGSPENVVEPQSELQGVITRGGGDISAMSFISQAQ